jgi:hypothetical protein
VPTMHFKITHNVQINVDLSRQRVVISCETTDGKSLHLEANYKIIDRIHGEIESQRGGLGPEASRLLSSVSPMQRFDRHRMLLRLDVGPSVG